MADIKNLSDINTEKKEPEQHLTTLLERLPAPLENQGIEKPVETVVEKREYAITKKRLGEQAWEGKINEAIVSRVTNLSAQDLVTQEQQLRRKQVEKILEEGLADTYLRMLPYRQQEFKRLGEKTAAEISVLIVQAKVKIKKIIELIKKWLTLIPGVDRFFLAQEAKIKTDKILELSHNLKNDFQ